MADRDRPDRQTGLAALKDDQGRTLTVCLTCRRCGIRHLYWRQWFFNGLLARKDPPLCGDCRSSRG